MVFTCAVASVPTCVEGERLSKVLAVICNCCIGAPLPLSNAFFRVPQIFSCCGGKSQRGFHLFIWSLTPYSFISIKTLEHCAGFLVFWEDFWRVLHMCEQLSLPFYCVPTNITFSREASETSSHSSVYFSWYCHESIPSATCTTKMLVREVLENVQGSWKFEFSWGTEKGGHLLLWSRYGADILYPTQCLCAAQEIGRGRGPVCS